MTEGTTVTNALVLADRDAIRIWDQLLKQGYNAQRFNDAQLMEAAEQYAKRLSIKTPLLYLAEEFPAIHGGKVPQAIGLTLITAGRAPITNTPRGAIAFNESYLKMLGHSNGAKPSKELLFTLGHEMGHIKQGAKYMDLIRKYPSAIGMFGMAAGLALLEVAVARAKKNQKKDAISDEEIQAAFSDVTAEERERVKSMLQSSANNQELHGIWDGVNTAVSGILKLPGYAMAGAAGWWGGKHVTRQLLINAEFQADEIGARLSGDPHAGIRCLKTLRETYQNVSNKTWRELDKGSSWWEKFNAYFDHAHPTDEARIARLENLAQEMERNAGKMGKNARVAMGSILERATPLLSKLGEVVQGVRIH